MGHYKIDKILLVSLPAVMEAGNPENDFNIDHAFNLGLAYLAGILRENNFKVNILDCLVEGRRNVRMAEDNWLEIGLSDEQTLERIHEFGPDLIGVSIPFSIQHYLSGALISKLRTAFPDVVIVVGGNHVTAVSEKMNRDHIDYFIVGEGEFALLELIHALNRNEPFDQIPGVASRETLTFQHAPHIQNLDDLPFPALDLLPLHQLWGSGPRWINMVATRGCVYDCNFCSIHTIMGYKIRRRSIENVIAEIRHWCEVYKIQEIYFEDDNLTVNQKWAKELFKQIAENNFGLRLYARNGIRADSIDKELLILMKAAGYHDFYIAPESGSQHTLNHIIGKKMKLEDCENAVKLAREVGIDIYAFFVLGFPQEKLEDIQATINFARHLKQLGCNGFWFSLAVPYPGTKFYDQCLEQGYITEDIDYRKLRVAKSVIVNGNLSPETLGSLRTEAMTELGRHPYSFYERLRRVIGLLWHDPVFFWGKVKYKMGILFR